MHILIVNRQGFGNHGDLIMLQVCIDRLLKIWPDAIIEIITHSPRKLLEHSINSRVASSQLLYPVWIQDRILFPNRLYGILPKSLSKCLEWVEKNVRLYWPSFAEKMIQLKYKLKGIDIGCREDHEKAITQFDLIVASGGGYITDIWKSYAFNVLRTFEIAIKNNIPTAMFCQGLGPLGDISLIKSAKKILPLVNLIALREKRSGLDVLHLLNVSLENVMVTGDDAIEFAYDFHPSVLGRAIGINLRVAEYSQVNQNHIKIVRSALNDCNIKLNTTIIPIPISFEGFDSDMPVLKSFLKDESIVGNNQSYRFPLDIIKHVGRCRIVVTGSYHAAVFALSQGIPAVGIAGSSYYVDKFLGLADQFGEGCEVVLLDDNKFKEKLMNSIEKVWDQAESLRPLLLKKALEQIQLSHQAYNKIYDIINGRVNSSMKDNCSPLFQNCLR